MTAAQLDHLAIAVADRSDGFGALLGTFGGRWLFDADAIGYRMCHIEFAGGMKIELLDPSDPDSFLPRFLAHSGPGPHHITFKVPSLTEFRERAASLGIELMDGRDTPSWREVFIHPKTAAMGTLLQAVEANDSVLHLLKTEPPKDASSRPASAASLVWIGLVTTDMEATDETLNALFGGDVRDRGRSRDGRWVLREWQGQSILILQPNAESPLQTDLAGRAAAVHHLAFETANVPFGFRPLDPGTGTRYLCLDKERSWLTRDRSVAEDSPTS